VNMNSQIFHSLWLHNGKSMTLYSYVYAAAALGMLLAGNDVSAMIALVLSEMNRVDKESRVLSCDQANAIIYEGDHPEEFDKDDDHDK